MLDNKQNQSSQFGTKCWVELNHESRRTYDSNSQNKFKNSVLKSSSCDYSDPYILVNRDIVVVRVGAEDAAGAADRNNKKAIFTKFTKFTDCVTEINYTQENNAKDIEFVMLMYNLIVIIIKTHLDVYTNFAKMCDMLL